ncbi:MAG: hypothetical protein US89_C0023G0005 [Candidatus Peregrinibacteria bacterium GW2011_GWF2_38_29]|nr:MAG: hypothetical protein US89_C0023G0005 [Candidatus Peregrinibacteria bacterium GW2011_GWF2_38_29]HBB03110.1 hypothetical protein [Candidatus Peregrinibacteria bacterium]
MPSSKTKSGVSELLQNKAELKAKLKNSFPHALQDHSPVVGILYDGENADKSAKNASLAFSLVEALNSLGTSAMLITKQNDDKIPFELREKVCAISMKSKSWEKFYYACDMMIVLADSADENTYRDMLKNGIIPIASKSQKFLSNYDPNHESGNCFAFEEKTIWEVFAATVRAIETYKFPYDWKNIIRAAL